MEILPIGSPLCGQFSYSHFWLGRRRMFCCVGFFLKITINQVISHWYKLVVYVCLYLQLRSMEKMHHCRKTKWGWLVLLSFPAKALNPASFKQLMHRSAMQHQYKLILWGARFLSRRLKQWSLQQCQKISLCLWGRTVVWKNPAHQSQTAKDLVARRKNYTIYWQAHIVLS